ncbi:MAG: hypothetical protein ACI4IL_09740 [Eubacterium sp.]
MSELKCKNCGGTMEIDETNSYAICEYCGEKQKIEKSTSQIIEDGLNTIISKSDERRELREKKKAETKEKIKPKLKRAKKIILFSIVAIVAIYIALMIVFAVTDSDDTASKVNPTTEKTFATEESTNVLNEAVEITDLFYSLDKVKQVLGEESNDTLDIEEYTRYEFGNIAVLCEQGTSNIYCINIECEANESGTNYTLFNVDINSDKEIWDNLADDIMYDNYDMDGNRICDYIIKFDGKAYTTEVVFKLDAPYKIIVFQEDEEA